MPVQAAGRTLYVPKLKKGDAYAAFFNLGADFARGKRDANYVNTYFGCLGLLSGISRETVVKLREKFREGAGDPNLAFLETESGCPYLEGGAMPELPLRIVERASSTASQPEGD